MHFALYLSGFSCSGTIGEPPKSRRAEDPSTHHHSPPAASILTGFLNTDVTLDIDLPGISGLEVCRELKERHLTRHTPVAFVTGRLADQDVQRGFEVGAVDYITKPFGAEFAARLLSHIKQTHDA